MKWYERRLIEAHAWLVTALLCAIYVEISLGGFSLKAPALVWIGTAGGIFVGALIVWHGLRRYFVVLREAEHYVSQSTCATCRSYAKYKVVAEHPALTVRCHVCRHEWTFTAGEPA